MITAVQVRRFAERLTIAARKDAAVKLIEGGMSQRQVAKVLGVNHKTIQRDVAQSAPENGTKSATGSEATKAAHHC